MVRRLSLFFAAMLYGASWFVVLANVLVTVLSLQEGLNPVSYLPMILLPAGIILYIHHLAGWFPFRNR